MENKYDESLQKKLITKENSLTQTESHCSKQTAIDPSELSTKHAHSCWSVLVWTFGKCYSRYVNRKKYVFNTCFQKHTAFLFFAVLFRELR